MNLFLLLHQDESYSFRELEWVRAECKIATTTELDPNADDLSIKITKEALMKAEKVFILVREDVQTPFIFRLIDPNILQNTNVLIYTDTSNLIEHPLLKKLGDRFIQGGDWKAQVIDFFNQ